MSQTSENMQRTGELHNIPEHVHLVAEQQRNQQHQHRLPDREQPNHANSHGGPGHGVTAFGHEDIAALAHQLWVARGCPTGSPDQDWFEAVKELRERAIAGEAFHG